ncbi:MAG: hypothetical protein IKW06_04290 [Clostridia bacterium]|nr:hypothetical protein [Clostridia bacterium]
MKKQIKSDSVLKFFSAVIAICLWFYVVQVESPEMDRVIKGVPVVFTQKNVLEDKNLIILNDAEYTIDVKIQGSRKYVMEVDNKNITVLADVGNISTTGRHVVLSNVVLPYAGLDIINKNPSTLAIHVDDLVTVEKPVEVLPQGTPKDSHVVGTLKANPETVSIRGPKTILDGIQSVAAMVDVHGKVADIAERVPLQFLGTNNKEITGQLLTASATEIEVHAEILKSKTVDLVPVFQDSSLDLVDDFVLDDSSIKKVKVAGAQTLIDSLTAIETKPISLHALDDDGKITIKLDLPSGVRSLDGDSLTLRFSPKHP